MGRRCSVFGIVWFWITVVGVVWCGFEFILPALYGDDSALLTLNKAYCLLMLAEMVVNWLLIKLVTSPFEPHMHASYMNLHEKTVQHGGFEIDLSDVTRRGGFDGQSYSLPRSSLPPSVRDQAGALYIVDAEDAESTLRRDVMRDTSTDYGGGSGGGGHGGSSSSSTTSGSCALRTRKLVFPYWAWKPCIVCQTPRPPRTHHCPICGTCVLKRDHHCVFTGSCIGLRNQRYFIVFTFWGCLVTTYCLANSMAYLVLIHVPNNTWWDVFLPVTFIRFSMGYIYFIDLVFLCLLYSVTWFCLTSVAFFREQIKLLRSGITSFEYDNGIKISNAATVRRNIEGVFGKLWLWNFLIPMSFLYSQTDNGVEWPDIKVG